MININQTSEQTKILIPRSNINGDIEKNNYVTEDELQEILKEHNSIPYLIIDYLSILDGDWQKVYDAISNNQPYLIYHKRHSDGYLITVDSAAIRDNYIDVLFCREAYNDNTVHLYYTIVNIYPDRLEVQRDEIIDIPTQFKTVNGNEITGTGDIIVESGNGNIVELTQSEYDNITPEENTLYVISDAPAVDVPNASIPYLIVSNTAILGGNFNDVYNAIENGNPYILYINVFDGSGGNKFSPAEEVFTKNGMIECSYSFTYFSSYGNNINVKYRVVNIYPDRVSVYSNSETTVPKTFKTINNQSIVGSGNITIEGGGGTEILYLWKLNGTTTYGADHNANVRNTLLSLSSSEEYPIIVVKDYNNDTICNNVYANASTNYVEIQCCNSRIGGTPNDLTDERYELLPTGMFRYVKNDVVATQNYVDEQIGNINNVLENIIG